MGNRHQMGKGYTRRHQDKQHDREKVAFQKADKKGIRGLMDEVKQLKEEVALLDQLHAADQKVIKNQADVITKQNRRIDGIRGERLVYLAIISLLLGWIIGGTIF